MILLSGNNRVGPVTVSFITIRLDLQSWIGDTRVRCYCNIVVRTISNTPPDTIDIPNDSLHDLARREPRHATYILIKWSDYTPRSPAKYFQHVAALRVWRNHDRGELASGKVLENSTWSVRGSVRIRVTDLKPWTKTLDRIIESQASTVTYDRRVMDFPCSARDNRVYIYRMDGLEPFLSKSHCARTSRHVGRRSQRQSVVSGGVYAGEIGFKHSRYLPRCMAINVGRYCPKR